MIDMIVRIIARFLKPKKPMLHKLSSGELLYLLSWCEKWPVVKVYDTAFAQVFPPKQLKAAKLDFEDWEKADTQLPIAVQTEIIRAIDIHVERGCLDILRVYAGVWDIARKASYILPFLAVMYWYWR